MIFARVTAAFRPLLSLAMNFKMALFPSRRKEGSSTNKPGSSTVTLNDTSCLSSSGPAETLIATTCSKDEFPKLTMRSGIWHVGALLTSRTSMINSTKYHPTILSIFRFVPSTDTRSFSHIVNAADPNLYFFSLKLRVPFQDTSGSFSNKNDALASFRGVTVNVTL